MPTYWQAVKNFNPLQASLCLLSMPLGGFVATLTCAWWLRRFVGYKRLILLGTITNFLATFPLVIVTQLVKRGSIVGLSILFFVAKWGENSMVMMGTNALCESAVRS